MTGDTLRRRIYRRILDELLGPKGFRLHNNMLVRKQNGLEWRIARQTGGIRSKGRTEFAFNLGVYVDGFIELRDGGDATSSRHVEDSAIYRRLMDGERDQWWSFDFDHDGEERAWIIAGEVMVLLECYGLPFLERFQSNDDVVRVLECRAEKRGDFTFPLQYDFPRLWHLSIVHALAGNKQKAHSCCKEALDMVDDEETREWLSGVDRRIGMRFNPDRS